MLSSYVGNKLPHLSADDGHRLCCAARNLVGRASMKSSSVVMR